MRRKTIGYGQAGTKGGTVTLVTFFLDGGLHRFFPALGADCNHVPQPLGPQRPTFPSGRSVAPGCYPHEPSQLTGGHIRPRAIHTSWGMLLPLRDVGFAPWLRQDVRVEALCVALVGDLLRQDTSETDRFETRSWSAAAPS
jgi:hypothetical protein